MSQTTPPDRVRVRRAPRFPAFLAAGGLVGVVVALVVALTRPADPDTGFWSLFALLGLFGLVAGLVVGAIVALLLDRRAERRAALVEAEREEGLPVGDGPDARPLTERDLERLESAGPAGASAAAEPGAAGPAEPTEGEEAR